MKPPSHLPRLVRVHVLIFQGHGETVMQRLLNLGNADLLHREPLHVLRHPRRMDEDLHVARLVRLVRQALQQPAAAER
jgi:hypothetical protein